MHQPRAGFTLIELLIVIVIIGILTTIALPRFSNVRERTYFKTMMADLRNLMAQQEVYYSSPSSNFMYASDIATLGVAPSVGVTVALDGVTNQGWAATATHAGLATSQACGVYYGTPATTPPSFVPAAGIVRCTNE